MKILNKSLFLNTKKEFEIISITSLVNEFVKEAGITFGSIQVFSRHTTLSIKINENEKLLLNDFTKFMEETVDTNKEYEHDNIALRLDCPQDEPKNASGHLKCFLLENSQTIPIIENEMQLGRYQDLLAIETSGPRNREIVLQIIGE